MRNLLALGNRYVDPSIVWQLVVRDLPNRDAQIKQILDELE